MFVKLLVLMVELVVMKTVDGVVVGLLVMVAVSVSAAFVVIVIAAVQEMHPLLLLLLVMTMMGRRTPAAAVVVIVVAVLDGHHCRVTVDVGIMVKGWRRRRRRGPARRDR